MPLELLPPAATIHDMRTILLTGIAMLDRVGFIHTGLLQLLFEGLIGVESAFNPMEIWAAGR